MNISLYNYVVALADDALVLGQRTSEWCSRAPFLEEDIAISNLALDYIGRARLFYQYAAELEGQGRSEDDLAYFRDEREFTNLLINELPNLDFAFSIARQYLLDVFYCAYLAQLEASADERLAQIAAKASKETKYHLTRSRTWMLQLGGGTDESARRLQEAINELWGYTPELFIDSPDEVALSADGVSVARQSLYDKWHETVSQDVASAGLELPDNNWKVVGGRQGNHSEHLGHMLAEMQILQRSYPGLSW
ncbi:MAG: 1,2-phenylacetyl-CoA epoxidase subunit PaaC [Pseudomonadales bacterium]